MRLDYRTLAPAALVLVVALMSTSCRKGAQLDYSGLVASGNDYLAKKDYTRAILQFKSAAQKSPKSAEPLYRLGIAYLDSGSVTEGVTALVRATELDPKHAGAQLRLAELLSSSQDRQYLEEGRKRLQSILGSTPSQSDALTALAVTESRLGETQNAEKHLQEALAASPAGLKAAVILARMKFERRDANGAEAILRAAMQASPHAAEPHIALAEFFLMSGRRTDAENELRAALGLDPANVRASLGLAVLYAGAGRKDDAAALYRQVSRSSDTRFRHLYGAYLVNEGKREEATAEFERLFREAPGDRDARTRLVSIYAMAGRTADAERVLQAALAKNPKDVDALLQRSEMLLQAGKADEAQANLNEVIRFKPESAPAHYLLSRVYGMRDSRRLQIQELTQAVQAGPEQLGARIELAKALIDSGSARTALDLLNQAPASQRQGAGYLAARNHALFAAGNLEDFSKGVAQGLAIARTPDLLVQDAQWKLTQKNYGAARTSLAEALKLNPNHLGALQILFRVSTAERNLEQGLAAVIEHARRNPRLPRVQYFAGERMLAAGRRAEARKFFAAAKTVDAGSIDADLAIAQMDFEDGNLDAARKRLAGLPAAWSGKPVVHLLLAAVEARAGNRQAAEQHYRTVLQEDPDAVVALNNLANLLAQYSNKPDEALKYAQRARELAPSNPDVGGTIGWLYFKKGLYSTALDYLKDAVELDGSRKGSNPGARRYYLGMTHLKLGHRREGEEILQQALRMNPELPEASLARAAMKEAASSVAR